MWTRTVKRAVASGVSRLSPAHRAATDVARILLYHSVHPSADPADRMGLRVHPDRFREQMAWLQDMGYAVVPLSTVVEHLRANHSKTSRTVAITFDDGYADVASHALPILRQHGFSATLFVSTGWLQAPPEASTYWDRWPRMGWGDLAAALADGMSIGSHGVTHRPWTRLSPPELRDELRRSKTELEDRLRASVETLSYPHGRFTPHVQAAVREAGFAAACCSRMGANGAGTDVFALRRIEIDGQDTLATFALKMLGGYDWVGALQR